MKLSIGSFTIISWPINDTVALIIGFFLVALCYAGMISLWIEDRELKKKDKENHK
jgi:hypothetical protein